ncbi:MAG TPA: right-handed parallel beta-helix repeat-containing protein [Nannocystis sp.]
MRALRLFLPFALWPLCAEEAAAAPCDCDHVLGLDVTVADGTALGVQPGDSVCVQGGARPFLRLQKFKGAEGQVVEIRNCDGQVDISNDDKGYALTIGQSSFVHLTGTGDDAFEYGFRARGSKDGPDYSAMSVTIGDLSSDIEVDHVEAYEAGFAGFIVKTDPRCDGSANLGKFVMYNVELHHNYIHDTKGEGIYFGSTGYGGREYTCDGEKVLLYPHEHHGAKIHHNLIENTGWDGAQIGVTPKDCEFHHNTIRKIGLAGEKFQQQGLQIGGASACEIYANILMDGPTNGIFILGADDTRVYNNLIVGFADNGIYANDQQLDLEARYRFAFNTIVQSGEAGITVFGAKLGPGHAYSNVVVGPNPISVGNDVVDFVEMANQTADGPDALGFVDAATRDFHLLADSPLRDVGVAAPELDLQDDLDGVARNDLLPDAGAFEFDLDPVPETDTDASTGDASTGSVSTGETGADPTTGATGPTLTGTGDADSGTPTTGDATTAPDSPQTTGDTDPSGSSSTGDTGQTSDGGCGCRGADAPLAGWLALLMLAPRRRRAR